MALKTNEGHARFGDVIDNILRRDGIDTSQVGMATDLVSYVNDRLQKAWSHEFWPQTMVVENKHYHQIACEGQLYDIGDILWDNQTQKYYECITTTSDFRLQDEQKLEANADLTPIVGNYIIITDTRQFVEFTLYEGETYLIDVLDGEGNVGIRHPFSTVNVDANGFGRHGIAIETKGIWWDTAEYKTYNATFSEINENTDWLKIVPYWQNGEKPTDAGSNVIHRVEQVSMRNPNRSYAPGILNYELLPDGILVSALAADKIWVKYQTECPVFTLYQVQSGVTYKPKYAFGSEARQADIVYDPETRNVFKAIADATSADPFSDTAKWQVVPFPKFLERYVSHAAYADWLASEGQQQKSLIEDEQAEKILYDLMDIHAPSSHVQDTLVYRRA